MTQKMIHELWAARKLDSKIAKGLMLESRCLGAQRFYMSIEWHEQERRPVTRRALSRTCEH